MMMRARSLITRWLVSMPWSCSASISWSNTRGSSTVPLPITQRQFGNRMPEGIRWNLCVTPSWTTVCPALLPPWERMTISVEPARMSMTLPLPSSPHWPPTRIATGTSVVFQRLQRRPGEGRRGPRRRLPGGVDEPGLGLEKHQRHLTGGPVAVLGDDQLGLVALNVRVVQPFPVQEYDEIGVLLERPGLSQVAELGSMVSALLRRAGKLAHRDHRDIELHRETLEGARDFRDFLGAILGSSRTRHQLDVVNNDQPDLLLHLQPPGFGAHGQDGGSGTVVDVNLALRERAHGVGDLGPIRVRDLAGAQQVGVNPGLTREQPLSELPARHLK